MAVLCLTAVTAAQTQTNKSPAPRQLFPPENLGLLEAADRHIWQKPDQIMDALGIADGSIVADIGAGAGWFTIHLARRVGPRGTVYAQDVQPQMLEAIRRRVAREGLSNVRTTLSKNRNTGLPTGTLDAALVVDVYPEVDDPVHLLKSLALALKPAGKVGIVNYTPGASGPGPGAGDRVEQAAVEADVRAAGLRVVSRGTFLQFQYLLVVGR